MNDSQKTGTIHPNLFRILAVILAIAGVLTLIPYPSAAKANIIGYKSLCTFTPMSTVISFLGAHTFYGLYVKKTGKGTDTSE